MKIIRFLIMALPMIIVFPLFSQNTLSSDFVHASPKVSSLFDQFYTFDHQIKEITITTAIRPLLKNRSKEEYQAATISYTDQSGLLQNQQIKVRARGVMRKEICDYPPLKLKFKKTALQEAGLQTFNKLKLVHQVNASSHAESYIFREYLAYRIYNLISPYSFRAQLIKVTYKDSEGLKKDQSYYGILLEPKAELAARLNGQFYQRESCRKTFLEKRPYTTMAVFQYMIGNTDWAIGNIHNIKLMKVDSMHRLIPIPYDFDYAGIVGAHYAVPHESLPIKFVIQRYYKGTEVESEAVRTLFLEKKDAILQLCQQFPHLKESEQKHLIKYLSEFFKVLEHSKRAEHIFRSS